MSQAGRPPKPNVVKILEGNPGGRPLPVEPLVATPVRTEAPTELTPTQKAIWDHAIEHAPAGLIRALDRDMLKNWVVAVDDRDIAEEHIREEGHVVKTARGEKEQRKPDGTVIITRTGEGWELNPWLEVREKAFQRMMKATIELGFSPTSRSRIALAGGGEKEKNRFSKNAATAKARA